MELFLGLLDLAYDREGINTLTCVVVGESGLYSLFCENRAVYFYLRETVESLNNSSVCELESVLNGLALDELIEEVATAAPQP